jgi:hypothetical protein
MMISYEEHLRQLAAKDVIIGKLTTELTAKDAVISKLKIDLAKIAAALDQAHAATRERYVEIKRLVKDLVPAPVQNFSSPIEALTQFHNRINFIVNTWHDIRCSTRQCVERMDGQTHDVCTGMFTHGSTRLP